MASSLGAVSIGLIWKNLGFKTAILFSLFGLGATLLFFYSFKRFKGENIRP